MSTYTDYLNLFKWNPETDGEEEFDIEKALNENWDKLDVKIKQHILNTAQTILDFENEMNSNFQNEQQSLATALETYKENIDEEIEDFKNNSFATAETVSDVYSNTKTYPVGSYCIYNNILYKCKTAVTNEEFDESKWEATNIAKELENRLEFELVEEWN